eukprot:4421437-Pyramimonas_sp.AAC.1
MSDISEDQWHKRPSANPRSSRNLGDAVPEALPRRRRRQDIVASGVWAFGGGQGTAVPTERLAGVASGLSFHRGNIQK